MKETVPVVTEGQLEIAEFKGKEIRKVLHDDEWYFSVVDVVEAVMETASPSRYWNTRYGALILDMGPLGSKTLPRHVQAQALL